MTDASAARTGRVTPDSFFRWEELAVSRRFPHLVRPVPDAYAANAKRVVVTLLDPIRRWVKRPVYLNSCYRTRALNDALEGSETSQHLVAEAADLHTGTPGELRLLFEQLLTGQVQVPCGQCIWYPLDGFIHLALPGDRYPRPSFHLHAPARGFRYARVSSLASLRSLWPAAG